MSLVTDMNSRERKSYIAQVEAHIGVCTELLNALRESDDLKAMLALVKVSLGTRFISEMIDVFKDAHSVNIPDHP